MEELSKLPLYGANYQPNSFKRKEFESKRVLYYNGFSKENKESEKYCEFTIFDDDTYKQPQRGNKNAKVKSVKPKKTSPKSRTKEAFMGKEIPMADYLHTVRNVTQIIIMNERSFLLLCEKLIERRDALRQVFGDKVPHRMKIAIINKSDESSSKLEEWRIELENNNIQIIDHLQRSDYEFLFENPVELTGDFMWKGSKGDMPELLKLRGGREGAITGSEPSLDMTSQRTYLQEEDVGIIISNELGLKEDDDAENVVDIKERMSNRVKAEDRNDTSKFVQEDILHEGNLHKHKDSVDSEDGVPPSLDIRSLAGEMNFVQRPKGWRRKIYPPEAENSTARIREAHPADPVWLEANDRNDTTKFVPTDVIHEVNFPQYEDPIRLEADDSYDTTKFVPNDILHKVNLPKYEDPVWLEADDRNDTTKFVPNVLHEVNLPQYEVPNRLEADDRNDMLYNVNLHECEVPNRLEADDRNDIVYNGNLHQCEDPISLEAGDRNDTTKFVPNDILHKVNLPQYEVPNRLEADDRNDIVYNGNLHQCEGAAPNHQVHLSKNFNLILQALVNYIRLHAMNAFIVPGSHLVENPIWTSEVYVIIRIFENGEEIIRRLFKNKRGKHAEDVCLEALKDLMKDKNTGKWRIMMYVSYSPCDLCRPKIIEFIGKNEISFGLRFHTLFQMNRASCIGNICKCKQFPNHDQNRQDFIDMKDNPHIDSIWIVAADERRKLSEVLQLNLSEVILQNLNTQKEKDDTEMELDARDLGILKSDQGVGVDLVSGVSGRTVTTEDGVNNNLTAEEEMNFVQRGKGWRPKIHTPEAENTTARTREAHPQDGDFQREEDKLDEATGGAGVGRSH